MDPNWYSSNTLRELNKQPDVSPPLGVIGKRTEGCRILAQALLQSLALTESPADRLGTYWETEGEAGKQMLSL